MSIPYLLPFIAGVLKNLMLFHFTFHPKADQ